MRGAPCGKPLWCTLIRRTTRIPPAPSRWTASPLLCRPSRPLKAAPAADSPWRPRASPSLSTRRKSRLEGVWDLRYLRKKIGWAQNRPCPLLSRHRGLRLKIAKLHFDPLNQWVLRTKTLADANRWIAAIQDVIECCPRLTTKFEKYVNAVGCSEAMGQTPNTRK